MKTAANALSVLLHPVWMPTLTIAICFAIDPFLRYGFTRDGVWILYGMVFTMTAFFPLLSALLMRRTGMVTDITMPQRMERIPAYFITLLYHGMCYYLLWRTNMHPDLLAIFLGALVALIALLVITFRWKISAHMTGIGGLIGSVVALMLEHGAYAPLLLCALFVVAGALGTARLIASDHSPAQIYSGFLLGCSCTATSVLYGGSFPWN